MVVRRAKAAEAETVANIIADAMFDDPPTAWAVPDPARRREILPGFFRLIVDPSIEVDGAFVTDDLAAANLWFPPGWELGDERAAAFEGAVRTLAGEYAESGLLPIAEAINAVHPKDPHWYLAFVGTRPEAQGRGLGTRLIRQ